MEGIKEAGIWVLGGVVTLLTWVFKRQISRIDTLEKKVNDVEDDLRLNCERDKHMEEAVKEIREGQKETQLLIQGFVQKMADIKYLAKSIDELKKDVKELEKKIV